MSELKQQLGSMRKEVEELRKDMNFHLCLGRIESLKAHYEGLTDEIMHKKPKNEVGLDKAYAELDEAFRNVLKEEARYLASF